MTPLRLLAYVALVGLAFFASVSAECEDDKDWIFLSRDNDPRSCAAVGRTNPEIRCFDRIGTDGVLAVVACAKTCDNCDGSKTPKADIPDLNDNSSTRDGPAPNGVISAESGAAIGMTQTIAMAVMAVAMAMILTH